MALLDALNEKVLKPPLDAISAEPGADNNIVLIHLAHTTSLLLGLEGVHITFPIGNTQPGGVHLTFDVPHNWTIVGIPNNAEHIRFTIYPNKINLKYRTERYDRSKQISGETANAAATTIYNQFITSPAGRTQYTQNMIREMIIQMRQILQLIREKIYSDAALVTLIGTRPTGGSKRKSKNKLHKRKTKRNRKSKMRKKTKKYMRKKTHKHR